MPCCIFLEGSASGRATNQRNEAWDVDGTTNSLGLPNARDTWLRLARMASDLRTRSWIHWTPEPYAMWIHSQSDIWERQASVLADFVTNGQMQHRIYSTPCTVSACDKTLSFLSCRNIENMQVLSERWYMFLSGSPNRSRRKLLGSTPVGAHLAVLHICYTLKVPY